MAKQFTAAQLRQHITTQKLPWNVDPRLADDALIPLHSLGGNTKGLRRSHEIPALDLKRILVATSNSFLLERRKELGLVPATTTIPRQPPIGPIPVALSPGGSGPSGAAAAPAPAPAAGASPRVDWRVRWGWPWITAVQDQDGCESCWAFCATSVVESMARIEHFVWSKRSEGDVHDGMGAKCANGGSAAAALDWITAHGICDPACYPYSTNDPTYNPTPDRNGRTVKIPALTEIGDLGQQKTWLDSVGPLGVTFAVYQDFDGYSNGVYKKSNDPSNTLRGYHCVCLVGYDDTMQAWLMKNSWGAGWGMNGYCWIGYGEADIDTWAKLGVQGTNTDPWTKHRTHNGAMIESGDGARHDNFELLATAPGSQVRHYWRDGVGLNWNSAELIGANDAAVCPTLTATTYNRNFECVYLTTGNRLHHFFFDQATSKWNDGGVFGPLDAEGVPGFIQSNYSAPGNFEVVVRTGDGRLNHWWRMNEAPWTWNDGGKFAANILLSGPSLIQSHYGKKGNLELVGVLANGQMQHWWRNDDAGNVWTPGLTFGGDVDSPPCMIEGQYGASDENHVGNFELCVAVGGQIQHWWRDNQGDMQWRHTATFGSDIQAVAALLEGSYDFNLEVVALRFDRQLQHFWRDGAGWHPGPVIGPA